MPWNPSPRLAAGLTWPRQAGAGGYRGAPGPAAWGGRGWGEPGGGGPRARPGAQGSARGGEGVCLFGACSLRIFSASGLMTARCSFEGFFLFLNKCQRCRHGTFCSHHPEFFRWNRMGRTGRGRGGAPPTPATPPQPLEITTPAHRSDPRSPFHTSKNGNTSSYTDSPLPLLTQKESYDGQYSALFFGLFFSLALPGGLAILGHNALH